MSKQLFRKKSIVIEAIQFNGHNKMAIEDFLGKRLDASIPPDQAEKEMELPDNAYTIVIPTLEGNMSAHRYDWIIKGVAGEFYPCKPDLFDKTYEKIEA